MVRPYSGTRDRGSSSRRRERRYEDYEDEYYEREGKYDRKKSSRSRSTVRPTRKKYSSSKRSSSVPSRRHDVNTRDRGSRGGYESARSASVRKKLKGYVQERSKVVREKSNSRGGRNRKKDRARDSRDDYLPRRRHTTRDNRDESDSSTTHSTVIDDPVSSTDTSSGDEYWEVSEYSDEPGFFSALCCCTPDRSYIEEKKRKKRRAQTQRSSRREIQRSNTSITTVDSERSLLQTTSSTSIVKHPTKYREDSDDSSEEGKDDVDLETACSIVMYDTLLMWKAPPPQLMLLDRPHNDYDDESSSWKAQRPPKIPLQIAGPDPQHRSSRYHRSGRVADYSSQGFPKKGPSKADCANALEQLKKRQRTESPATMHAQSHSTPMPSNDSPMASSFQFGADTEDQLLGKRNRSGSELDPTNPSSFPTVAPQPSPRLQTRVSPPEPAERQTGPIIEEIHDEDTFTGNEPKRSSTIAPVSTTADPPGNAIPTKNERGKQQDSRGNEKDGDTPLKGTSLLEKLAQAGIIMDRDKLSRSRPSPENQLSSKATAFLDSRSVHYTHCADPALAKLEDELNFLRSMIVAPGPPERSASDNSIVEVLSHQGISEPLKPPRIPETKLGSVSAPLVEDEVSAPRLAQTSMDTIEMERQMDAIEMERQMDIIETDRRNTELEGASDDRTPSPIVATKQPFDRTSEELEMSSIPSLPTESTHLDASESKTPNDLASDELETNCAQSVPTEPTSVDLPMTPGLTVPPAEDTPHVVSPAVPPTHSSQSDEPCDLVPDKLETSRIPSTAAESTSIDLPVTPELTVTPVDDTSHIVSPIVQPTYSTQSDELPSKDLLEQQFLEAIQHPENLDPPFSTNAESAEQTGETIKLEHSTTESSPSSEGSVSSDLSAVAAELRLLEPTLSEQSCMETVTIAAEVVLSTLSEDLGSIIDDDRLLSDSITRDLKKERMAALLSKLSFDARERTASTGQDVDASKSSRKVMNSSIPEMKQKSGSKRKSNTKKRSSTDPSKPPRHSTGRQQQISRSSTPTSVKSTLSGNRPEIADDVHLEEISSVTNATAAPAPVSSARESTDSKDQVKDVPKASEPPRSQSEPTPKASSKDEEAAVEGKESNDVVDTVVRVNVAERPKVILTQDFQGAAMARLVEDVLKVLVKGSDPDFDAARAKIVQSKATMAGTTYTETLSCDPITVLLKDIDLFIEYEKTKKGEISSTGQFLNRGATAIQLILSEHIGQAATQRKIRRSAPSPEDGLGRMGMPNRRRKAKKPVAHATK